MDWSENQGHTLYIFIPFKLKEIRFGKCTSFWVLENVYTLLTTIPIISFTEKSSLIPLSHSFQGPSRPLLLWFLSSFINLVSFLTLYEWNYTVCTLVSDFFCSFFSKFVLTEFMWLYHYFFNFLIEFIDETILA